MPLGPVPKGAATNRWCVGFRCCGWARCRTYESQTGRFRLQNEWSIGVDKIFGYGGSPYLTGDVATRTLLIRCQAGELR